MSTQFSLKMYKLLITYLVLFVIVYTFQREILDGFVKTHSFLARKTDEVSQFLNEESPQPQSKRTHLEN